MYRATALKDIYRYQPREFIYAIFIRPAHADVSTTRLCSTNTSALSHCEPACSEFAVRGGQYRLARPFITASGHSSSQIDRYWTRRSDLRTSCLDSAARSAWKTNTVRSSSCPSAIRESGCGPEHPSYLPWMTFKRFSPRQRTRHRSFRVFAGGIYPCHASFSNMRVVGSRL